MNNFIEVVVVDGKQYSVYTVSEDGDPSDGYDVFDQTGSCINEGDVLFDAPTEKDIIQLLN